MTVMDKDNRVVTLINVFIVTPEGSNSSLRY